MNSSGRDYAIGAVMIVVAVLSFVFLSGSTSVFIGIAGAILGAVFIIKAIQGPADTQPDPLQIENSSIDSGYDWDAHYQREFGGEQHNPGPTK